MSDTKDPTGPVIARDAPDTLAAKAALDMARMAILAVVAGGLIGFGSIAFLVVQAVPTVTGPVQLLSGVAFSAGLLMVLVTGAELFTGNAMFALPAVTGRLSKKRLFAAWSVVWTGNLIGSIAVAALFVAAGGLDGLDGGIGDAAAAIVRMKLAKGAMATFASGILANVLVCLAVWMAMGARSITAKAVALVGPVTVFVAAGLEHSVANMSLIPIGLMAGADGAWDAVARNLMFSTAGNIAGGAGVALMLAVGHRDDG